MRVCLCVYAYVYVCMPMCMYVCMYVCVSVKKYVNALSTILAQFVPAAVTASGRDGGVPRQLWRVGEV